MKGNKVFRVFGVLMIFALLISSVSVPAKAQDSRGARLEGAEAFEVVEGAGIEPMYVETANYETLPELTAAETAQLKWGEEHTHLAPSRGEVIAAEPEVAPEAGTESLFDSARPRSGDPLAPGSAMLFQNKLFGSSIPATYKSNVMEHSTSLKGLRGFDTGNWFGAYTLNRGYNWTYKSGFTNMTDFCCDQIALHDDARDIYIWLRMGIPNANGINRFILSIDNAAPFNTGFVNYSVPSWWFGWAGWWDYPHAQLTADYLYISWNMFSASGSWLRTVMLRFPLDQLAANATVYPQGYGGDGHFTFVPVSGADHVMYWASNWSLYQLRLYEWDDDLNTVWAWDRNIAAWNYNITTCGNPDWLARADDRVLTGARYMINEEGSGGAGKVYGKTILGWWWNAGAQSGIPYAHVEGAAFYEDSLGQVAGSRGRPLIYYTAACAAYPSMAPNAHGDLGAMINYSVSGLFHRPRIAFAIADDYVLSPPYWYFYGFTASSAGPSDQKWGDYNTVRNYMQGNTWYAAGHIIYPSTTNCSTCSQPLFFAFGRSRDYWNFVNGR